MKLYDEIEGIRHQLIRELFWIKVASWTAILILAILAMAILTLGLF